MFRFKEFTIHQDRCAMKVGTDGVLLGAWCPLPEKGSLLDVGTGTGLIALMCAQRGELLHIDALEIDPDACQQAGENIADSPFAKRVSLHQGAFQDFVKKSHRLYDAIVCNPPYFIDSLKCPDNQRNLARHTEGLAFNELIEGAKACMKEQASLSVILPLTEALHFTELATEAGLYQQRVLHIYPTPYSEEKRRLMSWVLYPTSCQEEQMVIEIDRHHYTEAYKKLTAPFYLKH